MYWSVWASKSWKAFSVEQKNDNITPASGLQILAWDQSGDQVGEGFWRWQIHELIGQQRAHEGTLQQFKAAWGRWGHCSPFAKLFEREKLSFLEGVPDKSEVGVDLGEDPSALLALETVFARQFTPLELSILWRTERASFAPHCCVACAPSLCYNHKFCILIRITGLSLSYLCKGGNSFIFCSKISSEKLA